MLVLKGHRQPVPATDLHRLEDRLVQYACMVGEAIAFCWGAYDNLSATQAAKGTALALISEITQIVVFCFFSSSASVFQPS
jgi:hypothetical protein